MICGIILNKRMICGFILNKKSDKRSRRICLSDFCML